MSRTAEQTVRFRHNQVFWVAAVIAVFGTLPLLAVSWLFTPVLLVPLLVAVWGWRAGTDADPTGLRLRALLADRHIPWSAVAEVAGDGRGGTALLLVDGRTVPLPAVRGEDLPRLVAASGAHSEPADELTDEPDQ